RRHYDAGHLHDRQPLGPGAQVALADRVAPCSASSHAMLLIRILDTEYSFFCTDALLRRLSAILIDQERPDLAGDRARHAADDVRPFGLVALLVDHAALMPQCHQVVAPVWDESRDRTHALPQRLVDALQQRLQAPAPLGRNGDVVLWQAKPAAQPPRPPLLP